MDRIPIRSLNQDTAGAYPEPGLRSFDAIHLATAEFLVASGQPISAFVTYDKHLAEVAERAGLDVIAPS